MIEIHNEDCFVTMERMNPHSVDVVLTSPFYNTNKKAGKTRTLKNTKVADGQYDYVRYDSFVDDMTDDEYSGLRVLALCNDIQQTIRTSDHQAFTAVDEQRDCLLEIHGLR